MRFVHSSYFFTGYHVNLYFLGDFTGNCFSQTTKLFKAAKPQTCRSCCFMYSHILFTTSARDNVLSPVPKNFTRASERGRGTRRPEAPFFCRFSFCFSSSEPKNSVVFKILSMKEYQGIFNFLI